MSAAPSYDAVVIGAGHNGLVAGAYLGRAGLRTLVLERRDRPGGALDLSLTIGRLHSTVISDLRLDQQGLKTITPPVRAFAPQPDGKALTLWGDLARTARSIREWSESDAHAYPTFDRKVRALASFLAHVHAITPPDLGSPSFADALTGVRLARAFRGLGGKDRSREALRVLPMAVADLVEEEFETEVLRGLISARGIRFAAMGPRSPGTVLALLSDSAGNDGGAAGETEYAVGGSAALSDALVKACRSYGTHIRCGAEAARITVREGRVVGVALSTGEEIEAGVVLSGIDPKRTLLGLVDPVALGPTLAWRAGNIRTPGVVAFVEIALDDLPRFAAADGPEDERLRGRIVIAPGLDYLERAFDASKYGRVSEEPYLEATIPTLSDPTLLAGGGHVLRAILQYAPHRLRMGDWDALRDGLAELVLATLERYAPDIRSKATRVTVLTPLDLEREYGLTDGHPMHGEMALDQFFAWRPLLGSARYRLPVEGLYLCGSGAHPGGGITGGPGANAAREALTDWRSHH